MTGLEIHVCCTLVLISANTTAETWLWLHYCTIRLIGYSNIRRRSHLQLNTLVELLGLVDNRLALELFNRRVDPVLALLVDIHPS